MKKKIVKIGDEKIDLNKLHVEGQGLEAIVYRYGDKVIKLLKDPFEKCNLTKEQLEYLASVRTLNHAFPKEVISKNGIVYAYTANFVKGKEKLEDMKKDSFLSKLDKFYTDGSILGKQGIMMNDVSLDNMIINDKINMVDYGTYDVDTDYDFTKLNNKMINEFVVSDILDMSFLNYNKKAYIEKYKQIRRMLINNPDLVFYLDGQMKQDETVKEYVKRV